MGNTQPVAQKILNLKDHPHIHGEHERRGVSNKQKLGSPPPHIHGEHSIEKQYNTYIAGSPPHTWGTLEAAAAKTGWSGITPTYMGNT